MSFRQGRLAEITVSGVNISSYCDTVDFGRDVALLETTTFTATSKSFITGLHDAKCTVKGKYDPATNGPAQLLPTLLGASNTVPLIYYPGGATVGQAVRTMAAYLVSYKESSEVGGIVAFDAGFQISGNVTVTISGA